MTDWKTLKTELLKDEETRNEYEKLEPKYAVVSQLIAARHQAGLSQKELAERLGTKQSAIARLEAGNINPTIGFLEKVASTLGAKLTIQLH